MTMKAGSESHNRPSAAGTGWRVTALLLLACLVPRVCHARSGGVDYSWGADALADAHDYSVTMMLYVVYLCLAVSAVVAVISALQIYIRMQSGEGETMKYILALLGAILFFIGATLVLPAFFGYHF